MVIYACKFCEKEFPSHHALECHVSRESLKKPEDRCGLKVERKRKKAQQVIDEKQKAIEEKEKKKKAKIELAQMSHTIGFKVDCQYRIIELFSLLSSTFWNFLPC